MSFASDINTVMNADSALNALVTGIYFQNAPDNQDLTEEFVVFNYELIDDISTFDGYNELDIYKHNVAVFGNSTESINTVIEAVRTYLDDYMGNNLEDVRIVSDDRGLEGEKEQYSTNLEYRIIYRN